MERDHGVSVERWPVVVLAVVGLGYALVASSTRPFTWAADVVTAVPLALVVVVTLCFGRHERRGAVVTDEAEVAPQWGWGWVVSTAPILVLAGWELYCLANLPRATHPTLSSLIDILDSTRAGKTLAFGSWIVLGWFLAAS